MSLSAALRGASRRMLASEQAPTLLESEAGGAPAEADHPARHPRFVRSGLRSPGFPLFLVAALVVVAALAWRVWLIRYRVFDPDEFEHIHACWSMNQGLLLFRDFFETHPPGLCVVLNPFLRFFNVDESSASAREFLFFARGIMWFFTAGILVATYVLGRLWKDAKVGAIAAALLATIFVFQQKTVEIRTDVPAAFTLLLALICLLQAQRLDAERRRSIARRMYLGGFFLGAGMMITQKATYAAFGVGVALVLHATRGKREGALRRRLLEFMRFAVGVFMPIALTAAYFLTKGGLGDLVQGAFLQPLKWQLTVPPGTYLRILLFENPVPVILGAAGLVWFLWRSLGRVERQPGDTLISLTALAAAAGFFLSPSRYSQSFLQSLPLLALFAAIGIHEAAGLVQRVVSRTNRGRGPNAMALFGGLALALGAWAWLHTSWRTASVEFTVLGGTAAAAALFGAVLGARREAVLGAILVVLTLTPLYREFEWDRQPNDDQLAAISFVIDNSSPSDTVLDGFTGVGVFRPRAFYYGGVLSSDVRGVIPASVRSDFIDGLTTGAVSPKFVSLDFDVIEFLGPDVVQMIQQRYWWTGVGTLWERRD
jgi:hypothetical protein